MPALDRLACCSLVALMAGLGGAAYAGALPHPSPAPALVRQNAPVWVLTATEVAARCRAAYAALSSYQVTSTVAGQGVSTADGVVQKYHASANILFVRSGKIRTLGIAMGGNPFAYVSDGTRTEFQLGTGPWKTETSPEMAIASATGISADAGATVPALLFGTHWGTPLALGQAAKPELREDKIEGVPYYVLTAHLDAPEMRATESLWIDEKTFLLRRSLSDNEMTAKTFVISGQSHAVPAMKMHNEQNFTNEKRDASIPDSTFALPAVPSR